MRNPKVALPVLVAVIGGAAMLQGAFYMTQLIPLTIVALVGAIVASKRGLRPVPPLGTAALILAAGIGASGIINGWPDGSAKPLVTLLFSVCCFVLAARAISADGQVSVAEALAAVGTVVAAVGLLALSLHLERFAVRADTWRLASTLTYQNAAGSLFTLTVPVTAVLVSARPDALRRVALALQLGALAGTLSRGAFVGTALAVVVLAVTRSVRPSTIAQSLAGALVIAAGVGPAVLDKGPWALSGLAGIAAGSALAAARFGPKVERRFPAAVAAVVIALVAITPFTALRGRISFSTTDRARVWSQTIDSVREPVFGSGPGTYRLLGTVDGLPTRTTFAHNEYLQTYVETGIVGLVSVGLAMLAVAFALWRSRRDPLWAAAVASLVAFAAHSALDFLWRIPVLPGMAFVLIALGAARAEQPPVAEAAPPPVQAEA